MTFHHIGFATKDIEKSILEFEKLGHVRQTEVIIDELQGVQLCFLTLAGTSVIELVAPAQEHSPVWKYLQKNGNIPYHFCYEVPNIEAAMAALKKRRYVTVRKPLPAIAFQNRPVAFLFHPDTGLIELLQATK